MIKLPGLIDPHVHIREPGATHKEDWDTGTAAALAGGFTTVLAMPNTQPPVTDQQTLEMALNPASKKARCDYAQYLGAGPSNFGIFRELASQTAGLKMYLDQTYGSLSINDMSIWIEHFKHWPRNLPIVAHAEGRSLAAVIFIAVLYNRSIHLAHVSKREEIILIRAAKEKGYKVTCEVTPHHLFLTSDDISSIGAGRGEVRPRLTTHADQNALWENLNIIDCFGSDHAPHTLEEKDSDNPPPGFPGLETILPLLLTAVHEGRLTYDDIVERMVVNPRRIFNVPEQPETWLEVDEDETWEIQAKNTFTRCGWTPFEGWKVQGRVRRVILRGREVFLDGQILAQSGYGKNIRQVRSHRI